VERKKRAPTEKRRYASTKLNDSIFLKIEIFRDLNNVYYEKFIPDDYKNNNGTKYAILALAFHDSS
jgi:hypothetical protein